jgi:serine/threonine protein phosphatase 1
MLKKLLKARRASALPPAAVPDGERVYAIGDVHGCADLLDQLLGGIATDDAEPGPARTTMIFLGDLVDRGPDSAAVIERLRLLFAERPDTRFLLGNHEEVFLDALKEEPKALRMFCRIGGRETIMSYGVDPADYDRMDYEELHTALRARVPASHEAFLAGFEDLIVIGDYAFVHAGVRPDTDLRCNELLTCAGFAAHFSTIPAPRQGDCTRPHHDPPPRPPPHRIGVDTGAYQTGRLTALGLESMERWTVQAG